MPALWRRALFHYRGFMRPEQPCKEYSVHSAGRTPIKVSIEFTEDYDGRWDKIFDIFEESFRLREMKCSTTDLATKEEWRSSTQD